MCLEDKLEMEFKKPAGSRDIDLVFLSLKEDDEILNALMLMTLPLRRRVLSKCPNEEGLKLLHDYNELHARVVQFIKEKQAKEKIEENKETGENVTSNA